MSDPTVVAQEPTRTPRRLRGVLAIAAATTLAYVIILLVGRAEDAAGARILGVFDPVFLWLRGEGGSATDWLDRNPLYVGGALSIGLALVAGAGLAAARRRAAPLLAACAVVALGVWGQALLLTDDHFAAGRALYLAALVAALGLGWWRPMRRLPGFPPTGTAPGAGLAGSWQPAWRVECAVVLALLCLGLVCRAWALTELSDFLDLEQVDTWLQSRTLHGVADFYRFVLLATNPGAAHMLPQWALFNVFGTSLFMLRMASVAWGTLSVGLMYWFVRRLAGPAPAVLAALLIATAPEQLFWSRSENSFFAPVPTLALLTLHIGLWMSRRLSFPAVLAGVLAMPASRYFYTTTLAMFLLPTAVAAHTAVFVRGAWKRLWYVVPLLALGFVAWWWHLTLLLGLLNAGDFRFRHPAQIYGGSAWTKQGEFSNATLPQLLLLQAQSAADNMARVVGDLTTEQHSSFGHWYMRVQGPEHGTTMNVGVVLLLGLGVAYLAGQLRDPRAWLLLVWVGLALLPGIGSRDATPRRMAMLFLAGHVIGSVFVAAVIRVMRDGAGRRVATAAAAAASAALLIVVATNAVSHFRMPIRPMIFSDYLRFLRPIVARSDTVLVNLPPPFHTLLVFDHADRFVSSPFCAERVGHPAAWLPLALRPRCSFADPVYGLALTPAEVAAARDAHRMQRVSFVFFVDPTTQAEVDIVRGLYPDAEVAEYRSPRDQRHIVAVTIDVAASAALRTPRLRTALTPPPQLLGDVPVQTTADGAPPVPGAVLEGGILIDRDGWYAVGLEPGCVGAELRVGSASAALADPQRPAALLAGVQPFALHIPDVAACPLPQRLTLLRADGSGPVPLDVDRITSPAVAALPIAAAPPLRSDAGYEASERLTGLGGRAADLAIDPDGSLVILLKGPSGWRLHRFTGDGQPLGDWALDAPSELDPNGLAIAPDGTIATQFGNVVVLTGRDGAPRGRWTNLALVWESQFAFVGSDRLVFTIPHRNALAVLGRDGTPLSESKTFPGGPPELFSPTALTLNSDGDLAVLQPNGLALRFETPPDQFAPVFRNAFPVAAASPGLALDGRERLIVPVDGVLQVFDADGTRLMADSAARDLSRLKVGANARVRSRNGRLYVLDPDAGRVWSLSR